MRQRLLAAAGQHLGDAKRGVGDLHVGIEPERRLDMVDRLVEAMLHAPYEAHGVVAGRIVRIECQRLARQRLGAGQIAVRVGSPQRDDADGEPGRQPGHRRHAVGVERHRALVEGVGGQQVVLRPAAIPGGSRLQLEVEGLRVDLELAPPALGLDQLDAQHARELEGNRVLHGEQECQQQV